MGSGISSQERVVAADHLKFFERGILKRNNESARHEASVVEVSLPASKYRIGG